MSSGKRTNGSRSKAPASEDTNRSTRSSSTTDRVQKPAHPRSALQDSRIATFLSDPVSSAVLYRQDSRGYSTISEEEHRQRMGDVLANTIDLYNGRGAACLYHPGAGFQPGAYLRIYPITITDVDQEEAESGLHS